MPYLQGGGGGDQFKVVSNIIACISEDFFVPLDRMGVVWRGNGMMKLSCKFLWSLKVSVTVNGSFVWTSYTFYSPNQQPQMFLVMYPITNFLLLTCFNVISDNRIAVGIVQRFFCFSTTFYTLTFLPYLSSSFTLCLLSVADMILLCS